MVNILTTVLSQLGIAYCLTMFNEYVAYAYIISLVSGYVIAVNRYYEQKEQLKTFQEYIKERSNEYNISSESDDDSSENSES